MELNNTPFRPLLNNKTPPFLGPPNNNHDHVEQIDRSAYRQNAERSSIQAPPGMLIPSGQRTILKVLENSIKELESSIDRFLENLDRGLVIERYKQYLKFLILRLPKALQLRFMSLLADITAGKAKNDTTLDQLVQLETKINHTLNVMG